MTHEKKNLNREINTTKIITLKRTTPNYQKKNKKGYKVSKYSFKRKKQKRVQSECSFKREGREAEY